MAKTLITNALIVNEGKSMVQDVLIENGLIAKIDNQISQEHATIIDASGLWLLPGCIDDQVHFREPGLTHKANIYTEAKAAVAGGVTSFMEMPNTNPPAVTQEKLEEKYQIAAGSSLANYSFFMGTTNDNLEELLKTDKRNVCGIKIFMGSSTGNMLVDDRKALESIFAQTDMLIALHCEDEATIKRNTAVAMAKYGEQIPFKQHPIIRDHEACYLSSSQAVELSNKFDTRIHILHISTAKELDLFRNDIPMKQKRITSEVCVHHLSFDDSQYESLGAQIKCNPAIKSKADQDALWKALLDDRLDVIATDHAPHTWDEKSNLYLNAPSGLPLVQHTLLLMLEHALEGRISVEKVVEKMAHAPADMFDIEKRGYIKEGYCADLVLVNPSKKTTVSKSNLLYKCGWSPFEGRTFNHQIEYTFVNGNAVFKRGIFDESSMGQRLTFDRK